MPDEQENRLREMADTRITVLGQCSRIIEYNKNPNVSCTFRQTDNGLLVSVVRAQRIYDDHRWPNPVVMKLENVLRAINPLSVETLEDTVIAAKQLVRGRIINYKNEIVKAWFYKAVIEYARIVLNGENKILAWRF